MTCRAMDKIRWESFIIFPVSRPISKPLECIASFIKDLWELLGNFASFSSFPDIFMVFYVLRKDSTLSPQKLEHPLWTPPIGKHSKLPKTPSINSYTKNVFLIKKIHFPSIYKFFKSTQKTHSIYKSSKISKSELVGTLKKINFNFHMYEKSFFAFFWHVSVIWRHI